MAIAKTLDILLRAPTGKLDADLKKGQKLISGFVGSVGSLMGPLAAALSFAGFTAKINEALTFVDDLSKRSIRLNIDIADLRGLQLAADLSGVALTEIEVGARTLTKQIGALSHGSQKQVALFKELGLTANDVLDKTLTEQIAAVGKGLGSIESVTRRNVIALELFGRSGQKLLPLLANNAQAVRDAMADIQRLGSPISAADGRAVESSNDAYTRLLFTFDSVFQTISVMLAPALERLYINLAEAIKPGTALNQLLLTMGQVITLVINGINELVGFISFLSESFGGLGGKILAGIILAVALNKAYLLLVGTYKLMRGAAIAWGAAEAALAGVRAGNLKAALAVAGIGLAAGIAFSDQINDMINKMLGATEAQAKLNDQVGEFNDLVSKPTSRKVNLGSASFGSQSALEQLFTVKTKGVGVDAMIQKQDEANAILGEIRDGVRAGQSAVGMFEFEEVDIQ